ncbi:hypothetical protein IQ03_05182 [Gemmobacter caeni]|uniref:Uncharacterized protein n=1 Tax=Gemmobacter caeni TaxID=589035 RepID=A0A2T6A3I8_9RHOB|nr:hypothetical protein [Gemmobacter caeni]PTX38382.1 hypothetical protein C8N34_1446 [Gemmobacter caeni]TWI89803.1 hypothetical protein IQ03_05182 [Gemmobacter caeni]
MNNEILQRVRVVLQGSAALTMDNVVYLIGEAEGEKDRLTREIAADGQLLIEHTTPEEQYPEIRQRMDDNTENRDRLTLWLPQLRDLQAEMAKAELAAWQDGRYKNTVKRAKNFDRVMDKYFDALAEIAAELNGYQALRQEIAIFNTPAQPHMLVNPQDRLVNKYPRISVSTPDAVVRGLVLVDRAGSIVYSNPDPYDRGPVTMARAPGGTIQPVVAGHFASVVADYQREKDQFDAAQYQYGEWQREAAHNGLTVEKVAMQTGLTDEQFKTMLERVTGRPLDDAKSAVQSRINTVIAACPSTGPDAGVKAQIEAAKAAIGATT